MSAAGMEVPKDMAVLDPRVVESRAEALLARAGCQTERRMAPRPCG